MITPNSKPMICTTGGYEILYDVRRGDTLLKIVQNQYGISGEKAHVVVRQILDDNPEIKSPDLIYSGQLLLLRFPWDSRPPSTPESADLSKAKEIWSKASKSEQEEMADLSYVYRSTGLGTFVGDSGLTFVEGQLNANITSLNEIAQSYDTYRQGSITKGQYDYARRQSLASFQKKIGPAEKLIFHGKSGSEALRMKPGGGADATKPFFSQVDRLSKIAKYARHGGIALSGVSLGVSCSQIARTPDPLEKDKIAIEALVGTGVGAAATIAVGIFLVSNPVGWGVAVALAVGAAAMGYFAGKGASAIYDANFNEVRIVETLMIDRVCR